MNVRFWRNSDDDSIDDFDHVVVNSERIRVEPITLSQMLELIHLIAPYVPLLEKKWPEFQRALKDSSGNRPEILSSFMFALMDELRDAPGTIVKIFSIFINRPPEWVGANVNPKEFIVALTVLDRINDFKSLFYIIKAMGFELNINNVKTDNKD